MGNSIQELASYLQPVCIKFLQTAMSAGIECLLVDTGRTETEQQEKLAAGVSWTEHSKHLPQPPEMKSEAFDVVPKIYLLMKGWNPSGPLWLKLGIIGENLGLGWGGRFPGRSRDPGHMQWIKPHDLETA